MLTQAELDLARLAMMIARMQLKTMVAVSIAAGSNSDVDALNSFEKDMEKLARKIETGEYRGSDAGKA